MPAPDPRIDAYIAKAAAFARPILTEVRARVAKACPAAEETIKWNVPFFLYEGKLLASMAAFKQHAKVGVWTGMTPTMVDVTTVGELPPAKAFAESVKEAARRIAEAGPAKAPKKSAKKPAATTASAKKSATAKKATASASRSRAKR